MSAFHDNALIGASGSQGYQISRSVRLRSSASGNFTRTFGTPTNNTVWTWSGWVKRGLLGISGTLMGGSTYAMFGFRSTDEFTMWNNAGSSSATNVGVYRDPSAWYHCMVVSNGTTITGYVNTKQAFTWTTTITNFNSAGTHYIGRDSSGDYFDGYLTEVNFIDGQALTPSSFGETDAVTGVWKPKKYAGTYGTNGFYLNFSDNSNNTAATIGKDYSGNGNNWTPNNISVTSGTTYDSMLDVPTLYADGGNGRGNYSVLSPIDKYSSTIGTSEANLKLISTSGGSFQQLRNTIGMTSGKWYMEWVIVSLGAAGRTGAALIRHDSTLAGASTSTTTSWCYSSTGDAYANNVTTSLSTGAITTGTDVVMYAFDADTGKFWMGKNGTWANSGDPATGANPIYSGLTNGPYFFGGWNYNTSDVVAFNFGQRPFSQTVPTGFKALNTQNLPEPVIKKGNQYFDVSTWSGDGATPKAVVTDLGFTPDLIWAKARSNTYDHMLYDSVRGAGSTKDLSSNTTGAEGATGATYGYVSSIDSAGFTVTKGSGATNVLNQSGQTFAAWNWKKGATQGFDIVTFTGTGANQSINHNLGVAPKMMISKRRDAGPSSWVIAFDYAGFTWSSDYFQFDTGAKRTDGANTVWRQAPSSTVFYVGSNFVNTGTYVAYLFSEVAGFSRMGSYQGNGSSDGPFVFCGFRPRWVMVKRTDSTGPWVLWDSAREPTNDGTTSILYPNYSDAEYAQAGGFDLLSNGFKLRASSNIVDYNASGGTYIFAAFSEVGFKYALGR